MANNGGVMKSWCARILVIALVVTGLTVVPALDDQAQAAVADESSFVSLAPERIIDSRPASQVGPFSTPWGAGEARSVSASAAAGVPAVGVDAVAVNVTTVSPSSAFSWLTIYPTGGARPLAASLNFGTAAFSSEITNDLIITKVDSAGNFTVYNDSGGVDVVIDIVGFYGDGVTTRAACAQAPATAVSANPTLSATLATLVGPGTPGLVAGSVNSAGLLRVGAAGNRQIATSNAMLATDRVHLGSDTKSMTGALLATLQHAGILSLSNKVTDVWPNAHPSWANVTMLDLLQHRGGAENSLGSVPALWNALWASASLPYTTSLERAQNAQAARAALVAGLTAGPPPEPIGTYAYSNAGYIMVGAAMEAATGRPWEELMCEYLFTPLGMESCGFGPPPDPAPWAHQGLAGALVAQTPTTLAADNPAGLGPAGTVHCPLDAWGKYLSWVLRGARGTDTRLPAAIWSQLLTPVDSYAAGWGVGERAWAGGTIYAHDGSNTMWYATAWVAPAIDRVYFSVANAGTTQAQTASYDAVNAMIAAGS